MKTIFIDVGIILTLLATFIEAMYLSYGGKYAYDGQFPYMALLSYDGAKYCGASIFHERWAVTAAHCLHDNDRETSLLTVGSAGDLGTGTPYQIEEFYIHPDYTLLPENVNEDVEYVVNDIGLIRLTSNIIFDDRVQPIALAKDEGKTYEASMAILTGWGSEAYGQYMHKTLHYIEVEVLTADECREAWPYADKHICTSTQQHQGVCYGDSGSPLAIDGVQVGVASTADTFCEALKPDLFTNVASFVPWIQKILKQYGDNFPEEPFDGNSNVNLHLR